MRRRFPRIAMISPRKLRSIWVRFWLAWHRPGGSIWVGLLVAVGRSWWLRQSWKDSRKSIYHWRLRIPLRCLVSRWGVDSSPNCYSRRGETESRWRSRSRKARQPRHIDPRFSLSKARCSLCTRAANSRPSKLNYLRFFAVARNPRMEASGLRNGFVYPEFPLARASREIPWHFLLALRLLVSDRIRSDAIKPSLDCFWQLPGLEYLSAHLSLEWCLILPPCSF